MGFDINTANREQLGAAQAVMENWLAHPSELGKKPVRIQCAGGFDYNEMHYYIFRFKESILGKWLVGVCGGFEGDSTEHCGHVFSEFQEYNQETAEDECIGMVKMIMDYWMQEAASQTE